MVRRGMSLIIAALLFAVPLAARAQATPAPAAEKTDAGASATVSTPAADQPAAGASATVTTTTTTVEVKKKPSGPTFTPYGFILLNAFANSRAFNSGDGVDFAVANGALNDRQILLSSRYNRIGVKVGNMEALGAKLGAVLEADFGEGFFVAGGQAIATSTQATNFDFYRPIPRLRVGYATAIWGDDDAKLTLLVGHDYGLVNPLFAVTLAYIGNTLFQGSGNLYTRAPQVKLSGDLGKDVGITVQAAVLDPLDQNVQGAASLNQENPTLSSGDRARIPELEARVAGRFKSGDIGGEVGVSGGYHKERYLLGNSVVTGPTATNPSGTPTATFTPNGNFVDLDSGVGGVDAIFKFPFVEVRGEGFIAHNGDMYFAHLGQGGVLPVNSAVVNAGTIGGGNATSTTPLVNVLNKRTKGFWAQAIVSPIPMIQLIGGYGVEVPFASDNIAAGQRTRNSVAHAGVIFAASKNLKFGAEGGVVYTGTRGPGAGAALATSVDISTHGYATALSAQLTF
jgi:hypothetical protein